MAAKTAKAIQRADADIFVDARHALDADRRVPGGVRIHVEHGIVTLTGGVQWASEKAEAEEVIRPIDGVVQIVNNITVARVGNKEGFEPPDAI